MIAKLRLRRAPFLVASVVVFGLAVSALFAPATQAYILHDDGLAFGCVCLLLGLLIVGLRLHDAGLSPLMALMLIPTVPLGGLAIFLITHAIWVAMMTAGILDDPAGWGTFAYLLIFNAAANVVAWAGLLIWLATLPSAPRRQD